MYTNFSAPPEHRIRCSIILLKPAGMAAGDGSDRRPIHPAAPPIIVSSSANQHPWRPTSAPPPSTTPSVQPSASPAPPITLSSSDRRPFHLPSCRQRPSAQTHSTALTSTISVLADSVEIQNPSDPADDSHTDRMLHRPRCRHQRRSTIWPPMSSSGPPSAANSSSSIRRTTTRGCTDRTHQPVVSSQIPISASDASPPDGEPTPISVSDHAPIDRSHHARSSPTITTPTTIFLPCSTAHGSNTTTHNIRFNCTWAATSKECNGGQQNVVPKLIKQREMPMTPINGRGIRGKEASGGETDQRQERLGAEWRTAREKAVAFVGDKGEALHFYLF
ncbi:hypothetical protein ACLOJK_012787 [Asimina triloba]